ncbi:MAG: leucyl aminopeptidase [Rhodocyclaceae bacterium]|nr:MAG: leucyl aminopeptidase [Rhodocyclaceae bacterium]
MEFSIKNQAPEKLKTDCLVLGVYEDGGLTESGKAVDKACGHAIAKAVKSGDLTGKAGTTLLLAGGEGVAAARLLLLGLGKAAEFNEKAYRAAIAAAVAAAKGTGSKDAVIAFCDAPVKARDGAWQVRQAVIAAEESLYKFDQLKSKKDKDARPLGKLAFLSGDEAAAQALVEGKAIAEGQKLMKDLANLPSNHCTPTYLAKQAVALGKEFGFKVDVLDRADMKKLGMNTLLAVAQGSHEPPKFIICHYKGGAKDARPVVLVGKGVTFDTGGISLKPAPDMDEMKYDMSGAASVLGTLKSAAKLKLPLNIVGVVAATENMPGGSAIKPGDIVTSMSGQTVEILNTDAEGRLILCDALTYVERFNPEVVVDVATLTGACVVALGNVATGLLANDDALAAELLTAGQASYDRAWQLPLWDDYQELLKSPFADMANIGGRWGGTITAACFLARYAEKYKWAHLDIAGTSYRGNAQKGSTGRPVPLLTHFLMQRAAAAKPAKMVKAVPKIAAKALAKPTPKSGKAK